MASITNRIPEAKKADNNLQHLVFGYVRSIQKCYKSLNTIPVDIIYLCVLFLFQIEQFDIIGSEINVSKDKSTIIKVKSGKDNCNWLNTSYGKAAILSTSGSIVTWKIKLGTFDYSGNICMGISSTTNCQDKDFTENAQGYFYAVSDGGTKFETPFKPRCEDAFKLRYGSNDVVTIILNLKDEILSFAVNDRPAVVGWINVRIDNNVSYRFAASMRFPLDSMSIVDFAQN